MGKQTLTLKEASLLLKYSIYNTRRLFKAGKLQGIYDKGKNGAQIFIYRDSVIDYINGNGKGRKRKTFANSEANFILSNYEQVNKELQGALIQIGSLKNQVENYERMLTSGELEKRELDQNLNKLSQRLNEANQEINKRNLLIKRYKIATVTASIISLIFLLFAVGGIMFL